MTASNYFSRLLCSSDEHGRSLKLDEAGVLAVAGPKVVLGEPGMGKSELIRELGRRLDVQTVTASRFMRSKDPARFVVAGKPLLIDALDEAMARAEGEAVDLILAQLEDAGSPEFIMSCRASEWQARGTTSLQSLYGKEPRIFSLEALSRNEARCFLEQRFVTVDAERVVAHLETHGIAELYGNPLTLGLMGRVAERDAELPATRAALFERVCNLVWPEHDEGRQDLGLGKISAEEALSAAGAIMAGLLFAGAEAISLEGPLQLQEGDVRLADLERLPGAHAARVVFASKLFHSVGVGRAKPIHRVIAEFLGARWLAKQAVTWRVQNRLLMQFHGGGAVVASLRGLHAWLAFHSTAMAPAVIEADPLGLLRYGETSNLSSALASSLLDSLEALAVVDPYFAAGAWDGHTAKGLMTTNLRTRLEATISSSTSNSNLRALLIEGLIGSPLAADLAEALSEVMLSTARFYRERKDAALALMPYRERDWWRLAISDLRDQGTEDSTRLARSLIEEIDCDVPDVLLVETLLAEMGATICPLPNLGTARGHMVRFYGSILERLPAERLVNVINLLADSVSIVDTSDWETRCDVARVLSLLIVRSIDDGGISPCDAAMLWNWLGALEQVQTNERAEIEQLRSRLQTNDDLRHAVQHHVLYVVRPRPTIWMSEIELRGCFVGLSENSNDIAWFLERLSGADNKNQRLREDWQDLMRLGVRHYGFDPALRAASRQFEAGDAQLELFVHNLQYPKKLPWQIKEERQAAKAERKKRIALEARRRHYTAQKTNLRAGEFSATFNPACVYLGMGCDLNPEQAPTERLIEWLGDELGNDALAGFEAALHRSDIPTPAAVAQSFAESKRWNYCHVVMAGLLARQRAGLGFSELSVETLKIGLLNCYDTYYQIGNKYDDLVLLRDSLERVALQTTKDREDFARLWVEPSLIAGCSNVSGLHTFISEERWRSTGVTLALEWLSTYQNLPLSIEEQLVDCLVYSGEFASLKLVASARHSMVFREIDNLFSWLAVDILVRFDSVLPDILDIGINNPEFIWTLRDRFQPRRYGAMLGVTITQAKWIFSQFRDQWPFVVRIGSSSGDRNAFNATDFLLAMVKSIADETSAEASEAIQELIAAPSDTYTEHLRHQAAEQRQKRAEEDFSAVRPLQLGALLTEGPPSNADDLKSLVIEEISVAQKVLHGDDLDRVRNFWTDSGKPRDENRCRDQLAGLIEAELKRYGIQRITEADMPNSKRADLAFACGELQLPMEIKGQWHPDVWDAATDQLDLRYLIDWRSGERGIYCVLWFGEMPSASGRRLQAPPQGVRSPTSADDMRALLIERIPVARRALIDVVVLDLTAGRPT
jgi:hypothetical protein